MRLSKHCYQAISIKIRSGSDEKVRRSLTAYVYLTVMPYKGNVMRLLLSIVLLASLVASANAEFKSQEELGNWFTYYYKEPDPSKIPDAIEYMSQSGWLDNKKSLSPIFGFLAGGFKNNPEQVPGWVSRLTSLNKSHFGVVVLGLWYADLPDSQKRVYAILEKHPKLKEEFSFLSKGTSMPIEKIPLEQGPWVLDALWGNFMATGDKTPVIRIMSTLPWIDVKGDMSRLLVGGAARWSLTSNAVQHNRIMEFCEEEVKTQPTEVADKLREIIETAKKELESGPNRPIQPTPKNSVADG